MSIHVLENGRVLQLQTAHSSYQIGVDDYGYLLHLWYGKRMEPESLMDTVCRGDTGFSGNPYEADLDRGSSPDTLPMEYPGFGCGDYRDSAVCLAFPDGSRAADFRFEKYAVVSGTIQLPGLPCTLETADEPCETLVITLREKVAPVTVELVYGVYERCDVITRSVRVANCGDESFLLERCLSCSMDFMEGKMDMMTFAGRHIMERIPERVPVTHARSEIYSLRGMSSHQANPSLLLCRPETDEVHGDCWGLSFVYSGSFTASAQMDQRGQTRVNMGIHPDQFCWRLGPGVTFYAPQVVMCYSDRGFDALSQRFHHMVLDHLCRSKWARMRRPVLFNSWEAAYFRFNRHQILGLAQSAKALGAEMLVLDDGWFGKRDNDLSGLGDWVENTEKLGGSLKSLAEAVNVIGLRFGLWVEPEMVSEDSDLYRAHPDWALAMPGRKPNRSRYQLVLDMSRQEVVDYLYESLCRVLDHAPIDYIKWDFNRSVCDVYSHVPDAFQGEVMHRWMLGTYSLLERLAKRYPKLLLETCSGGGGRFDMGMLCYSPQIWCSDNTDAVCRMQIQYGTSFFYPPIAMASHVSVCPNHQTGRTVPMETRFNAAMTGAFGYELDATKLPEEERGEISRQIEAYLGLEPILREGTYHRLTQTGGRWMGWEYLAADASHALVFAAVLECEGNGPAIRVHPRGLAPDRRYICRELNQTHSGQAWMSAGIALHNTPRQYESRRFLLEAIDE